MAYKKAFMRPDKRIALVAHDKVFATGTTGALLERELGFPIKSSRAAHRGGDRLDDRCAQPGPFSATRP